MKGRGVPLLFKLPKMTACSEWTKKRTTLFTHHLPRQKTMGVVCIWRQKRYRELAERSFDYA